MPALFKQLKIVIFLLNITLTFVIFVTYQEQCLGYPLCKNRPKLFKFDWETHFVRICFSCIRLWESGLCSCLCCRVRWDCERVDCAVACVVGSGQQSAAAPAAMDVGPTASARRRGDPGSSNKYWCLQWHSLWTWWALLFTWIWFSVNLFFQVLICRSADCTEKMEKQGQNIKIVKNVIWDIKIVVMQVHKVVLNCYLIFNFMIKALG